MDVKTKTNKIDVTKLDKHDLLQACRLQRLLGAWHCTQETTHIAAEVLALKTYFHLSGLGYIVERLEEAQKARELSGISFLNKLEHGELDNEL